MPWAWILKRPEKPEFFTIRVALAKWEREILICSTYGKSNKEISDSRFGSVEIGKRHANTRVEAVMKGGAARSC